MGQVTVMREFMILLGQLMTLSITWHTAESTSIHEVLWAWMNEFTEFLNGLESRLFILWQWLSLKMQQANSVSRKTSRFIWLRFAPYVQGRAYSPHPRVASLFGSASPQQTARSKLRRIRRSILKLRNVTCRLRTGGSLRRCPTHFCASNLRNGGHHKYSDK